MKTLFLIRHAKSSWADASLRDFDRPLNQRGLNDAPKMAKVLKREGHFPDQIISSPANRALTTAKFIADGIGYSKENIKEEEMIYGASVNEMMQLINGLNNDCQTVFLFGHNPTFTDLVEYLGDLEIGNLPTCGIVGFQFEVDSWQHLSGGMGIKIYEDYPKNHR